MSREVTKVPYLIDGHHTLSPATRDHGRGFGWSVASFKSSEDAARFVQNYPNAAMPCWRRFEVIEGKLIIVR